MINKNIVKFKSTPYLVKCKDSSTIDFLFIYPVKYNKKYLFYLSLMKQILLTTSFDYQTEEKYKKRYQKLMIIDESMYTKRLNNNLYIEFTLTVPNPNKISNYNLEEAFSFFVKTIYNPNVANSKFNEEVFEREKCYLKEKNLYNMKNVYAKSYQSFLNIVDDNGILKDNIYNNMDLIDTATPEGLYEVYHHLIQENNPIIIVYGNVDKKINNLITKYVHRNNKRIMVKKDYYHFFKPYEKVRVVEEKSKYNQSILYVAYKIKKIKREDQLYIVLIKNILGVGANSLIFKTLRVENGLVYSAKTWCNIYAGLLVVEAYIDKKSKKKVISKVENIINRLKDKKFLKTQIERILKDMKLDLIREQDNKRKHLVDFLSEKFDYGYNLETLIDFYSNMDFELLIDFIKRLKLDTIYFLEGEFDEKEKNI